MHVIEEGTRASPSLQCLFLGSAQAGVVPGKISDAMQGSSARAMWLARFHAPPLESSPLCPLLNGPGSDASLAAFIAKIACKGPNENELEL